MEAYSGRGGEVRRVNIIYFISRIGGHVDHPHLFRVHRLSTNGVRLRDIKRWLSVVRGKDMPESYAWSYKRRYKAGYVWQDLLDEDLITPISDNEYVLKGSEIYSSALNYHGFSSIHITDNGETIQQHSRYTPMDHQTKPLIENHAAPPLNSETATLSMHDSTKLEETKHLISKNEEIQCQKANDVPFYLKFLTKIKRSMDHKNIRVENANEVSNVLPSNPHCSMTKSCSKNGSNSFRNLMTCFLVDTKDSAIKTQCRSSRVLEANGSSKNKKNEK